MTKTVNVVWKVGVRGEVNPLRFSFNEIDHPVDSIGRRWQDEDGEHILVMVQPGDRVVELVYKGEDRWEIVKGANWLSKKTS